MGSKEKLKELREECLADLRDAYSLVLNAFHKVEHYTAEENLHKVLFPLNRAIKDLEENLKGDK